MTLPAYAHVRQESLEQSRDGWMHSYATEDARHGAVVREQARQLYPLYVRWQVETGQSLRSVFIRWLTGEKTPSMKFYERLNAGRALHSGLDHDLPAYHLATLGKQLDRQTPAEVQERLEKPGGLEAMQEEQRQQRQEGLVSVPVSELPAIRETVQGVSESESLPMQEAHSMALRAFGALSPLMKQASLRSARTGEQLEDALRTVLGEALDNYGWLMTHPCAVPGCQMPAAEAHHLKLTNTRSRSQTVLLELCHRHHQAQTGPQAAHANHQTDWIAQHWGSVALFWEERAALYAERLFGEERA